MASSAALLLAVPATAQLSWAPRANLSPPRGHHAGGVIGTDIFVAGGGCLSGFCIRSDDTSRRFDATLDQWFNVAGLPERRAFCAGAVATREVTPGTFRQRFYVIGGHDVDIAVFPDNEVRNWILELSPETNAWRRIPNDIPGRSVGGIKAATVGNKVYMMGGFDPDFTNLTNQVFVYDPNDPTEAIAPFGDVMPVRASDGAVAAHGTRIYYFGGYGPGTDDYGIVQTWTMILDTTSGTWNSGAPVPQSVANAAAVTVGDTIYLAGGWDGSGAVSGIFNTVLTYDPVLDTWGTETSMECRTSDVPGRSGLTLHLVDDGVQPALHAVGGALGTAEESPCNEYTAVSIVDPGDPPLFGGIAQACEGGTAAAPEVHLSWAPATSPVAPPITYNVYRDTSTPFTPSAANLIASGLPGTSYIDGTVACFDTFHYVVRAQDSSVPPIEDQNLLTVSVPMTCVQPSDRDSDAVPNGCDPCPDDAQDDIDGDSFCADVDNCPDVANDQTDMDRDLSGDECDLCLGDDRTGDQDDDDVCDVGDNCVSVPNTDQADGDVDGSGDACDECLGDDRTGDRDTDDVCDDTDNCVAIANTNQADANGDGVGDACQGPCSEPSATDRFPAVTPLLVTRPAAGTLRLTWEDIGAPDYAVFTGRIVAFRAPPHYDHVRTQSPVVASADILEPAVSSYFLIAAECAGGTLSSLGRDSFGVEIPEVP